MNSKCTNNKKLPLVQLEPSLAAEGQAVRPASAGEADDLEP